MCAAGPLADELRPYASVERSAVRQSAVAALDSVKPSLKRQRAAAVAAGNRRSRRRCAGRERRDMMKFAGALRE
jgi:hypothetical protein